jgi:hypothetical protein
MILIISRLLLCGVYVFPAHTVAGDLRSVVPFCPLCHPSDHDILTLNYPSITPPDLPDWNLVLNLRYFRTFSNSVCAAKKACYRPFFVLCLSTIFRVLFGLTHNIWKIWFVFIYVFNRGTKKRRVGYLVLCTCIIPSHLNSLFIKFCYSELSHKHIFVTCPLCFPLGREKKWEECIIIITLK